MSHADPLEHDWFPLGVPANVRIGERSWVYSSYAFLHYRSQAAQGVEIGADTGVYQGTFFDLAQTGTVRIGNHCLIVAAIFSTSSHIEIADYAMLSHDVVLADGFAAAPWPEHGAGPRPAPQASPASIFVGENCWIGARATLLAGAHLEEGVIVGAGCVVNFRAPAHSVLAGNPAHVVGTT